MLMHALARQSKIRLWSGASLLHDCMQQYQPLVPIYIEENSAVTTTSETYAQLMQSLSHWTSKWHTNGPPELQGHQTPSDLSTVFSLQGHQPLPYGLTTPSRREEYGLYALHP